jgi:hypothetical protein
VEATTVGEAWMSINLEFFGVAAADAAAAGWGGDRLVVAGADGERFALAWISAWDAPSDAAEFADAYASVVDQLDFPAEVLTLDDGRVLVAHASDAATLERTIAAAGG